MIRDQLHGHLSQRLVSRIPGPRVDDHRLLEDLVVMPLAAFPVAAFC